MLVNTHTLGLIWHVVRLQRNGCLSVILTIIFPHDLSFKPSSEKDQETLASPVCIHIFPDNANPQETASEKGEEAEHIL